jgi:hypothetical protein
MKPLPKHSNNSSAIHGYYHSNATALSGSTSWLSRKHGNEDIMGGLGRRLERCLAAQQATGEVLIEPLTPGIQSCPEPVGIRPMRAAQRLQGLVCCIRSILAWSVGRRMRVNRTSSPSARSQRCRRVGKGEVVGVSKQTVPRSTAICCGRAVVRNAPQCHVLCFERRISGVRRVDATYRTMPEREHRAVAGLGCFGPRRRVCVQGRCRNQGGSIVPLAAQRSNK